MCVCVTAKWQHGCKHWCPNFGHTRRHMSAQNVSWTCKSSLLPLKVCKTKQNSVHEIKQTERKERTERGVRQRKIYSGFREKKTGSKSKSKN